LGIPKTISALTDKHFQSYGILGGQKGVYLPFYGSKFKLNFLSSFDGIFLHHVKEIVFVGSPKKFQL
jgi:hypothetical protein